MSTQVLAWHYRAIANMANYLEVFTENFTAKQKDGLENDFFSYFECFFKQRSPHAIFKRDKILHKMIIIHYQHGATSCHLGD